MIRFDLPHGTVRSVPVCSIYRLPSWSEAEKRAHLSRCGQPTGWIYWWSRDLTVPVTCMWASRLDRSELARPGQAACATIHRVLVASDLPKASCRCTVCTHTHLDSRLSRTRYGADLRQIVAARSGSCESPCRNVHARVASGARSCPSAPTRQTPVQVGSDSEELSLNQSNSLLTTRDKSSHASGVCPVANDSNAKNVSPPSGQSFR